MSHWRHTMVDGAKIWISYQQPAFFISSSHWQLIQNLAPSTIVWRQCDIRIEQFWCNWKRNSTSCYCHSGCRCRGLQFGEIQIVICCVDQKAKMKRVSQTKLPLPPVGFYECMYVLVHMSLRLDYKIWQVQREKKCMYLCMYQGWTKLIWWANHTRNIDKIMCTYLTIKVFKIVTR